MAYKRKYPAQINVMITQEMRDDLDNLATDEEVSIGDVVRAAITTGLDALMTDWSVSNRDATLARLR